MKRNLLILSSFGAVVWAASPAPAQLACGDAFCIPPETRCSCPADCGAPSSTEVSCADAVDNDCDGLIDCADPDCATSPVCTPVGTVPTLGAWGLGGLALLLLSGVALKFGRRRAAA